MTGFTVNRISECNGLHAAQIGHVEDAAMAENLIRQFVGKKVLMYSAEYDAGYNAYDVLMITEDNQPHQFTIEPMAD